MAYATTDDIKSPAFGLPAQAFEGLGADDAATDAILSQALDAASSVADGYLAGRYTLPLSQWGDDLRGAVCAIASYNLMMGRGYNPEGGDEQLRLRFEDARAWLSQIARGQVSPAITDSTPTRSGSAPAMKTNAARGW